MVHHINKNGTDNRYENLEIKSRGIHTKEHNIENTEYIYVFCKKCGKKRKIRKKYYNWKKRNGQLNFFCSVSCSTLYNKKQEKYYYFQKIVIEELENGLNGYKIAKKYNINKKTIYNHINGISFNKKDTWLQ